MGNINLTPFLEDLERRIDPANETSIERDWLEFADGRCAKPAFTPSRKHVAPGIDWPAAYVNDGFHDVTMMIYHQLRGVSRELETGKGLLLNVRANYGTGIVPTMFGAELLYLDRQLDTLPCSRPLADGGEAVRRIVDNGKANYGAGLAVSVFEFAERYAEAVDGYPKIKRFAHVYPPDLQGPFPLADMLWGSNIYFSFIEDCELLHRSISFMADVILEFHKKWTKLFPSAFDGHAVEWGLLHKGGIIVRNDSCVNISGEMYREFVMPYDQRILGKLGGGIHFCGRGDHYVEAMSDIDGLSCINMSQPHLNDTEVIYRHTVDKGIAIVGLAESEAKRALTAGRDLHGLVSY